MMCLCVFCDASIAAVFNFNLLYVTRERVEIAITLMNNQNGDLRMNKDNERFISSHFLFRYVYHIDSCVINIGKTEESI